VSGKRRHFLKPDAGVDQVLVQTVVASYS